MQRTGAIMWMACLQFFLAEQVARLAWTLPYSFAKNYVSDLGAIGCSALVCSPWHALMNASFLLQGVLIAGGATVTGGPWRGTGRMGMWLLIVCGMGVIIVGLVPEDSKGELHRFGAVLHFIGGGLGITVVGFSLRRGFGWFSVAVGLTVMAGTVVLGEGNQAWVNEMGEGALERVAAYGIAGWMVVTGAWRYRESHVGLGR